MKKLSIVKLLVKIFFEKKNIQIYVKSSNVICQRCFNKHNAPLANGYQVLHIIQKSLRINSNINIMMIAMHRGAKISAHCQNCCVVFDEKCMCNYVGI